jgi:hypothetical protein
MTAGASNLEPSLIEPPPAVGRRSRRRWWIYLGVSLGAIVLVALGLVVGIAMYWHSLIKNYTATQSQPLPVVPVTDSDFPVFHARWTEFQEAVVNGTAAEPFRASAAELNLLIAQNPGLKDRVRMIITNHQVFGQFTFPLDQAKQRELQGRYINGLARLNLEFQEGWLTVSVVELKANGKPIPRWILKKIQKQNLAKDLDQNQAVTAFLHQLDTIKVQDDQIVLVPEPPARR